VVADVGLLQILNGQRANLFQVLRKLRTERGAMIQSYEQFQFTYRAIRQMAYKVGCLKVEDPVRVYIFSSVVV
jgi:protein tyrosine phosphatase